MKLFHEKQFLNRWWLIMFILAIVVIIIGTAYYATENSSEHTTLIVSIISLLIAAPIVFALLFIRLETRMDEKGISTSFKPFQFTRKFFPWAEIEKCYVRDCNPKSEYGGWGLRGLGQNSKAYIVWGNKGIQIITKDGTEFLIGTQEPRDAQETINNYHTTYDN